jgi:hypothetical protein
MKVLGPAVLALLFMFSGCGDRGAHSARRIQAPGRAYAILLEKVDRGACCTTRITGWLEGFDGEGDRLELFKINGTNDVSLRWNGPNQLQIATCNARKIQYRSAIWKKDVSEQLFVSIVNLPSGGTGDAVVCRLPNSPAF